MSSSPCLAFAVIRAYFMISLAAAWWLPREGLEGPLGSRDTEPGSTGDAQGWGGAGGSPACGFANACRSCSLCR